MKIGLKGWNRHVRDHTLIDTDLSRVRPLEDGYRPHVFGPLIKHWFGDTLVIGMGPAKNLRLHGSYHVSIRLTKDEIANLARIAFDKDSFADVIDRFSEKTHRT